MNRNRTIFVVAAWALAASVALVPVFIRAAEPAVGAGSVSVSSRPQADILSDLHDANDKLQSIMPSVSFLADAKFRKGDGQKAIAPLKKMTGLLGELSSQMKEAGTRRQIDSDRWLYMSFLVALGDADTIKMAESKAASTETDKIAAQSSLAMGRWIGNSADAAAQAKVLDEFEPLVKANVDNEDVASALLFMSNVGSANDANAKHAVEIVRANLKVNSANDAQAMGDGLKTQKELLGKPLTIAGRTGKGGKFTSVDYKGHVVLVDFWATWCGPCVAGLPEVKKVYSDYHTKGLEIVGVSCDSSDDELNKFIQDNGMTWMQLREDTQNEKDNWHPLAKKVGVDGIPTMFLIDKKGILRYIDARENLESEVKSLLAEEVKPDSVPPAALPVGAVKAADPK